MGVDLKAILFLTQPKFSASWATTMSGTLVQLPATVLLLCHAFHIMMDCDPLKPGAKITFSSLKLFLSGILVSVVRKVS